ncbi:MAG TPA: hypothetical protein VMZ51_04630 [Acidimicrobiales bacterium]|nr:hypothetical protein [Acidimicrobiales bacterium]
MEERSVAIEIALEEGDEEIPDLESKLSVLRAAIVDRGGVPLVSKDGRRYGARFFVTSPGAESAIEEGVEALQGAAKSVGLPEEPVVDAEASTLAELTSEEPDQKVPDLIGVTELADLLGVSNQLVTVLVRAKGFPPPVAELNAGPVWKLASIDRFIRKAKADPGSVESSTRPG